MKKFLVSFFLSLSCFFFLSSFIRGPNDSPAFVFDDPEYSFQMIRTCAQATSQMADLNECIVTASLIEEGNDESWYKAWHDVANRLFHESLRYKKHGHIESSASALLRASNYYRTSEFFLRSNTRDPRIVHSWKKSVSTFDKAMKYLKIPVTKIAIPFEEKELPALFFKAKNSKGPLLIVQTGFDGTKEEFYGTCIVQAALQRGIHCLVFEGPGQAGVLRVDGIPFRYNWETVVTPVIDYVLKHKKSLGVDKKRIALMGISFGGYLVPRALVFEKRIKLGIVNGGILDFHEMCMKPWAPLENMLHINLEKALDDPILSKIVDNVIYTLMKTNVSVRWTVGNGMFTFHASSPTDWLKKTRPYTLRNLAKKIRCKMLVVNSEHDTLSYQSINFYNALSCPKDYLFFHTNRGGGEHCQVGAPLLSNEHLFIWLEKNL